MFVALSRFVYSQIVLDKLVAVPAGALLSHDAIRVLGEICDRLIDSVLSAKDSRTAWNPLIGRCVTLAMGLANKDDAVDDSDDAVDLFFGVAFDCITVADICAADVTHVRRVLVLFFICWP